MVLILVTSKTWTAELIVECLGHYPSAFRYEINLSYKVKHVQNNKCNFLHILKKLPVRKIHKTSRKDNVDLVKLYAIFDIELPSCYVMFESSTFH